MLSDSSAPGSTDTLGQALTAHYERVSALLADVGRLVERGDVDDADDRLTDFEAELLWHIRLEEDIVAAAHGAAAGRPSRIMSREHVAIVAHIEAIRQALDDADR